MDPSWVNFQVDILVARGVGLEGSGTGIPCFPNLCGGWILVLAVNAAGTRHPSPPSSPAPMPIPTHTPPCPSLISQCEPEHPNTQWSVRPTDVISHASQAELITATTCVLIGINVQLYLETGRLARVNTPRLNTPRLSVHDQS